MVKKRKLALQLPPELHSIESASHYDNFSDVFTEIVRLAKKKDPLRAALFVQGEQQVGTARYSHLGTDSEIEKARQDFSVGFMDLGKYLLVIHSNAQVPDTDKQNHYLVATVFCA